MNASLPSISIVVPSFNQGQFLAEALHSLFAQDYPQLEVLVMDGGSQDESLDVIRAFAERLAYWQSEPDGGQSAAINAGVARSRGRIVGWLNSDDLHHADALWTVGRAARAFPEHGLLVGNGFRLRESDGKLAPFCRRHLALNREALAEGLDYVLQPATFFSREAWDAVGGLDPTLRFCMDWDVILKIAARAPAILVNEFLAVSREHADTKTSTGGMARAEEILRLVRKHSGRDSTPGTRFYVLEAVAGDPCSSPQVRAGVGAAMLAVAQEFAERWGNSDGFPEKGDPQDSVYLPFPDPADRPARVEEPALPTISIITPSYNQAEFLGQTLDSVFAQDYPRLEAIVYDGGSDDGSVEILESYADRLAFWVSEKDRGPAHAINKGLARATGEVLGWLSSDDVLTEGALLEVGRAFAKDPKLDLVYGNAVYIDERNRLHLADHGAHRTGVYYGDMMPWNKVPAFWSYVHAVPQPTVFFRRRLLEKAGPLDESYQFIFDFELFFRFARHARVKKIERLQAFYRIHAASKTSNWSRFLEELYRFSRPWWPRWGSAAFRRTLKDYHRAHMRRRYGPPRRDLRLYAHGVAVGLSAAFGIGNPESLFRSWNPPAMPTDPLNRQEAAARPRSSAHVLRLPPRDARAYRSMVSGIMWPRNPGHSGGEIRDFHLLRHLLSLSSIEYFAIHAAHDDGRPDLRAYVDALHSPLTAWDPAQRRGMFQKARAGIVSALRQRNVPVWGERYHGDAAAQVPLLRTFTLSLLQERLRAEEPDFLFVTPQTNPAALFADTRGLRTRVVLGSYDVEAVRLSRFAQANKGMKGFALRLEAERAARYEAENLERFDGVIAVSEAEKAEFCARYALPAERVLVIENGVDPDHFAFAPRRPAPNPRVVFAGNMSYLPNQQAAAELLDAIMPLVWEVHPHAALWVVGHGADQGLLRRADGKRVFVTGQVDDVRRYLDEATVVCTPLRAGAGTKYKILEALSAGVPTVCTPMAADGLDVVHDRELLIAETPRALAQSVLALIADQRLGERLAQAGRTTIERRYSWDANLPRLDAWLPVLQTLPRRGSAR
jgi:glycosyltransferase involved in cell wall biosynthesis